MNAIIDLKKAFSEKPPELDFIWPGFLAGTVGALIAPGATGKSFLALEAAMAVACDIAGGDLVGLAPAHTGRVVYIAGEDPPPVLVARIHAIGTRLNQSAREAIAENMTIKSIMGEPLDITDDEDLKKLIEWCAGTRLIVLDTLEQALYARQPAGQKLIHHSDRGSQYLSIRYTDRLTEAGIEPSAGSKGDRYETPWQKPSTASTKRN